MNGNEYVSIRSFTITACTLLLLLALTTNIPKNNNRRRLQDPKTVETKTTSPQSNLDQSKIYLLEESIGSSSCPSNGEPIRIACLGDSLTFGDGKHCPQGTLSKSRKKGLDGRGNYPMMLQDYLGSDHFIVRNFGRSGATACNSSDIPYVETAEYQAAIQFRPHVAIIMLGTNDSKDKCNKPKDCCPGPRPEAFVTGYQQILEGLVDQEYNEAPRVFAVPPPVVFSDNFGIQGELLPSIRAAIRSNVATAVAAEKAGDCGKYSINHAPVAGSNQLIVGVSPDLPIRTHQAMFDKDGVHLNKIGTRMLACSVLTHILSSCGKGWDGCFVDAVGDTQRQHWEESKQSCYQHCLTTETS